MTHQNIGRYHIRGELGQGGMATVYHAFDPSFEREVAIKMVPPELMRFPHALERFQREAKIIASLDHAAVVPVYDVGEHDGAPYLVMRYMPGGTLSDRIGGDGMPLEEAARIIERIAPALEQAHGQGIIHRDIKPSNLLFDQYGEVYLSDFGIVKLAEDSMHMTGSGMIGTPPYMSPEQAAGSSGLDGRSDVYSLSVVLYQMLTGKLPYEADTPIGMAVKHLTDPIPDITATRTDLPAAVQAVITKALAKDPAQRYQTAGELAADLRAVAGGKPPSAVDQPVEHYQTVPMAALGRSSNHETQRPAGAQRAATIPAEAGRSRPNRVWMILAGIAGLVIIAAGSSLLLRPLAQVAAPTVSQEPAATLESDPTEAQTAATEAPTQEAAGTSRILDESVEGVTALTVDMTLGATQLSIAGVGQDSRRIGAEFRADPAVDQPQVIYTASDDGSAMVRVTQEIPGLFVLGEDPMGEMRLLLPADIPLNLRISPGLGGADIDLSGLDVRSLTLNAASTPARVMLPAEGEIAIRVEGTFADIDVSTPDDAAGLVIRSIDVVNTLGTVQFDLPAAPGYTVTTNSPFGIVRFRIPEALAARIDAPGENVVVDVQNARIQETGPQTWQSEDFGQNSDYVVIDIQSSTGTILILP